MAGFYKRELFACIICGRSGMDEDEMKFHITTEHDENTICPYCDQNWETVEERNHHISEDHIDFLAPCPADFDERTDIDEFKFSASSSESHTHSEESMLNGYVESCVKIDDSSPCCSNDHVSKMSSNLCSTLQSACGSNKASDFQRACDGNDSKLSGCCHEDEENMAVCSEGGRSKLFLDVSHSSNSMPSSNANMLTEVASNLNSFCCPFCSFSTNSEAAIEQHVNHEHCDILSPMKAGAQSAHTEDFGLLYSCPFCASSADTPRSLETHINEMHSDVLTPTKWEPTYPGTSVTMQAGADHVCVCPVCEQQYPDTNSLARHVEGHFSAEKTPDLVMSDKQLAEELHRREVEATKRDNTDFQSLQVKYGMDERTSYKQQYEKSLEKAVVKGDMSIGEYHSQKATMQANDLTGVDDGHSCTKGLIARLEHYHRYSPGFVDQAWLCTTVDHYSGSYGDKGWGCGYRNLQMLLSSLVQDAEYCKILFNGHPLIPSIPKIQHLIEESWSKGFDKQGCEQLGGRVVNTRKWIGATEIVTLLSAHRIKCKLLDFHYPSGKDGTHPTLFQWVKNYFETKEIFKPPLYLQHQGHSRTVIGVEEMKDKSLRLLLFDPSSAKRHMEQFYGKVSGYLMKSLRRTMNGLKAKQYQIVVVVGVLTDREYEESKVLRSEKIS